MLGRGHVTQDPPEAQPTPQRSRRSGSSVINPSSSFPSVVSKGNHTNDIKTSENSLVEAGTEATFCGEEWGTLSQDSKVKKKVKKKINSQGTLKKLAQPEKLLEISFMNIKCTLKTGVCVILQLQKDWPESH